MITALIACLLSDLPADLKAMPAVASVRVAVECADPSLTIVHIRDWHFVEKKAFAIDVRDVSDEQLSDNEVDELFEEHREAVALVQKQQKRLIRKLGIKQVFQEGFTAEELPAYQKRIGILRDFRKYLPIDDRPLSQFARYEYQTDMLQIGASGQLLIDEKIDATIPADDAKALEAANPIKDGRIVFDEKAIEFREDAIVTNLQTTTGTAVLILGGAHDLSNNVPDGVRLIVVTVSGYLKKHDDCRPQNNR
jgi:hypothetical protein